MARFYAQLCTLVFVLLGIGGLFLGNAGSGGGGDLGPLTLHLTWARDILDIGLLLVFVWIGFVAPRHAGRLACGAAGALLTVLGVAGFLAGDAGFLGMHFPAAIDILDLIIGVLAVIAALGTLEDEPAPVLSRH